LLDALIYLGIEALLILESFHQQRDGFVVSLPVVVHRSQHNDFFCRWLLCSPC